MSLTNSTMVVVQMSLNNSVFAINKIIFDVGVELERLSHFLEYTFKHYLY